jgi:2',3'-cyclic-nucleotide 2'-phosphodiesterase (5'-nucleotidase family)
MLLSHLGLALRPEDRQRWDDPHAYSDEQVAADFPELAAIVGGHTHLALEQPLRIGQTVIAQAGDYGRYLGRLDLDLDAATGEVSAYSGRLIACDADVPPDPTISGTLELVREEAERLLAARVGTATVSLPHFFDQPSPFAKRVADALREVCQADLAVFYSGFAHQGLPAGPITRGDLYRALPGSAHVTAAEVTGAQLRRLVERMLASKYRTESFNPQRGAPPLGLPAASSNVHLAFDLAAQALTACTIDGAPLDDARSYRLASTYTTLNDLAGQPEYDYIGLRPGQVVEMVRVEEVLWEVVEGWVKERGTVS